MFLDDKLGTNDTFIPTRPVELTQAYLMSVTTRRDIVEFPYRLSDEKVKYLKNYSVIVHYKRLNGDAFSQSKYDGRLLAICDSGIFLYRHNKHKVRYYPYRVIWMLSRGLNNSRVLGQHTMVLATAGAAVGAAGSYDPATGAVAGFFIGGFYGGLTSMTYIVGKAMFRNPRGDKYCKVFAKTSNGIAFRERGLKKSHYIRYIDISRFPQGDSNAVLQLAGVMVGGQTSRAQIEDSRMPVTVVRVVNVDTVQTITPAVEKPISETVAGSSTAIDSVSLTDKPTNKKDSWLELKTAKGYNAKWMYSGFSAETVRTAFLINQFSWIRQRPITAADLKKLKSKSELQFLAMWITTAAGYSFREIAAFNKDQVAFLQPKEPYLAETVLEGTAIDPIVLLDLDVENLRVLYGEWTK